jgi:hypothetical protein
VGVPGGASRGENLRLLDLFCGRWGWSRAFAARGWDCLGIDLAEPPETPDRCTWLSADVLNVRWNIGEQRFYFATNGLPLGNFDFICASSPCEEFSVHGMKHFHPNPKYPEMGILLFNHTRQLCEASGASYVMENVRAAQQFVGPAAHHCGPFYLWGNAVPAIMPQGITKGTKFSPGRRHGGGVKGKILTREEITAWRRVNDPYWQSSKSSERKAVTAQVASIPPELGACVAEYAERLLEQKAVSA